MCHGLSPDHPEVPITKEYIYEIMSFCKKSGFTSINYNDLEGFMYHGSSLPSKPIMFDFDHPMLNILKGIAPIMSEFGYVGNIFVNTGFIDQKREEDLKQHNRTDIMSWDQVGEIIDLGWHLGAHTVTHPNLSKLVENDPDGKKIAWELDESNYILHKQLGIKAKDFAFTGTSWSQVAEDAVKERYRFGRLWIIGSDYQANGEVIKFSQLAGVECDDEDDGGPPFSARFINKKTHPYRLPSMDIQYPLMYGIDKFKRYLDNA